MSLSSIISFVNSSREVINGHIDAASKYSQHGKEMEMCRELVAAFDVTTYIIGYVNRSGLQNSIQVVIALRGIMDQLDTLEKISSIEGVESKCYRYLNLKRKSDQVEESEIDTGFSKKIRSLMNY